MEFQLKAEHGITKVNGIDIHQELFIFHNPKYGCNWNDHLNIHISDIKYNSDKLTLEINLVNLNKEIRNAMYGESLGNKNNFLGTQILCFTPDRLTINLLIRIMSIKSLDFKLIDDINTKIIITGDIHLYSTVKIEL